MRIFAKIILFSALCLASFACGSDDANGEQECAENEVLNPIDGSCKENLRTINVPKDSGGNNGGSDGGNTGNNGNNGIMDMDDPDMDQVVDLGPDLACETDVDGDNHISIECGGDDCDDLDPNRAPGFEEICDKIDNNCDTQINEGLTCTFFAHSSDRLYEVDPFAQIYFDRGAVPDLFDIDTHPDGTLYGITSTHLFRFNAATDRWTQFSNPLGANVGNANGMAIDNEGNVWITSQNDLFSADLVTGEATLIGGMGGSFSSSGDCVVTKADALYMTSSHTATDSLVFIDGTTGLGSQVGVTGFDSIYALTAAWNTLYGLNASGQLIEIDSTTGVGTLIYTFQNVAFFGAASTPGR